MNPEIVDKLEGQIEDALAMLFARLDPKRLPLLPSQATLHLMAKAAVTVYETAVENARR